MLEREPERGKRITVSEEEFFKMVGFDRDTLVIGGILLMGGLLTLAAFAMSIRVI